MKAGHNKKSVRVEFVMSEQEAEPVSYTHLDVYKRQAKFLGNHTGAAAR